MRARDKQPEWDDMQGIVLSAYSDFEWAQYLLFHVDDVEKSRAWLADILKYLTTVRRRHAYNADSNGDEAFNVNIAFTAAGLARLAGIAPVPAFPLDVIPEGMQTFPYPFLEGMGFNDHRARILGSFGNSAPREWRWGGPKTATVDILVCVYAKADQDESGETVLRKAKEILWPPEGVATEVGNLPPTTPRKRGERREHFGFVDGLSQPILVGSPEAERFPDSRHLTAVGEVVCGYPDGAGITTSAPALGDVDDDFGRNGSYLVLMQLFQDVAGFRDATMTAAGGHPQTCEEIQAKIVGRRHDGTPLVPYSSRDDNEFGFAEDPYGFGCPLGAHIRRANPRDAFLNNNVAPDPPVTMNRHRILRRGRPYGPMLNEDGSNAREERGLFFLCLNADIERQFEFIQQNWINNPSFVGLGDERDPLIGGTADGECPFTIPMLPAPTRVTGLRRFIRIDGGQYFFLPGVKALRRLVGVKL